MLRAREYVPGNGIPNIFTTIGLPRPHITVNNDYSTPFFPKLRSKPNALKTLSFKPEFNIFGKMTAFVHPYKYELEQAKIGEWHLKGREPSMPDPLEVTACKFVDTTQQLDEALWEMRHQPQIAVDVYQHSYRSFQGLTCVLLVSTGSTDYVFDALKLRDRLQLLNEVFTDPQVVKIFHNAESKLKWMQRDLALYVVSMFDTQQGAVMLKTSVSLASLLLEYCSLRRPTEEFDLADWRLRPLPGAFVGHARLGVHYLIYIYECMKLQLLHKHNADSPYILQTVFQRCTQLCKKRFVKPVTYENSHWKVYIRSKKKFDQRQLLALQMLYLWRDSVARERDESYGFVMSNRTMLQLAEMLPLTAEAFLGCCQPVSYFVWEYLNALHEIILFAYYS